MSSHSGHPKRGHERDQRNTVDTSGLSWNFRNYFSRTSYIYAALGKMHEWRQKQRMHRVRRGSSFYSVVLLRVR